VLIPDGGFHFTGKSAFKSRPALGQLKSPYDNISFSSCLEGTISWEIAVRLNPDNLEYKINLAKMYFQADIYREAVREWKSVLEKDLSNKIVKNLILAAEKNIK